MPSPPRQVLVRSMTWESYGVLPLELVDPAGAALPGWEPGAHLGLLHGGRRRASMAFLAELERYGPRVAIRPEDEHGLLDLAGELTPQPDTVVYCCGPEPLLQAVEAQCADWPPGSLKVERFPLRELTAEEAAGRGARDGDLELVLARSGQQFEVPAGCSILEVLEKNGIYPNSSCLEGTCGTCETAVLEGVPDHRDSILDEEDRAGNETMMCVSRARSSRLVLDL